MANDSHRAKIATLPLVMALLLNRPIEVDQRHALVNQSDRWFTPETNVAEVMVRLHYWILKLREDFEFDYSLDETSEEDFDQFLTTVRSQYEGVFTHLLQDGASSGIQPEVNVNGDPQSTVQDPKTSMQHRFGD